MIDPNTVVKFDDEIRDRVAFAADWARREGMIAGLERALEIANDETWGNHPTLDRIRAEIERLKQP